MEALADFSEVIRRNPRNAHAIFRRAFTFKALKVSNRLLTNSSVSQKLQKTLSRPSYYVHWTSN